MSDEFEEYQNDILAISKYVNEEQITQSTEGSFFTSSFTGQSEIDSAYLQAILQELERWHGTVMKMVYQIKEEACHEFMYFVNQFNREFYYFIELVDAPNDTKSRKSTLSPSQIRVYLCRFQIILSKILGIFEVHVRKSFPPFQYIQDYLTRYRHFILTLLRDAIAQYQLQSNEFLTPNQFVDEAFASCVSLIHIRIIRTLSAYFVIYKYSALPPQVRALITGTIAQALHRLIILQERIETGTKTINMTPVDVRHLMYQFFSDLQKFLAFTEEYLQTEQTLKFITIPDRFHQLFKNGASPSPLGQELATVELFIHRKCEVCRKFFTTPLWEFLQQLTRQLGIRIRVFDTFYSEHDAFCYGVYGINQIPSLRYQDRVYYINPAAEQGGDPHGTVKRELLDFFHVLGLYDPAKEQIVPTPPRPKNPSPEVS
ncbi:MAG: hypothetical protein ACTSRL_14360 [Candidatus Helarchaeota archaeon]|nr:hypothetical protein [Deltaproteobacteria bacterium]